MARWEHILECAKVIMKPMVPSSYWQSFEEVEFILKTISYRLLRIPSSEHITFCSSRCQNFEWKTLDFLGNRFDNLNRIRIGPAFEVC